MAHRNYVFIVYAAPDRDHARDCRDALVRARIETFLDDQIEPGLPWDEVLQKALDGAHVILVLVTPNWPHGHYNRAEVATAIRRARENNFETRVVPVFLAGGKHTHAPYGLQNIQGIDIGMVPEWVTAVEATAKLLGHAPAGLKATPKHVTKTKSNPARRNTLVRLYPDKGSIRRVLEDADVDIARVDFSGNATTLWHEALKEVENQGKTDMLIEVVRDDYPGAKL